MNRPGPAAQSRPYRANDAAWRRIGEETAVLSTEANRLRLLSEVGGFIWERCDGQRTIADITSEIVHHFDVLPLQAHADALAFITDLVDRGLVVLDAQTP